MHPGDSSRANRRRQYLIAIGASTATGLLFALPSLSNGRGWSFLAGSLAQWWSLGAADAMDYRRRQPPALFEQATASPSPGSFGSEPVLYRRLRLPSFLCTD